MKQSSLLLVVKVRCSHTVFVLLSRSSTLIHLWSTSGCTFELDGVLSHSLIFTGSKKVTYIVTVASVLLDRVVCSRV